MATEEAEKSPEVEEPLVSRAEEGKAEPQAPAGSTSKTSLLAPRRGKNLSWQQLSYSVGKGDKTFDVLRDTYGTVPAGKVAALMGPSGAGKSSLLNVLAGRIAPSASARIRGVVKLDGDEIDPVANRTRVAYVMQDDALLPTTTPREALTFSAALRRRGDLTVEERDALVSNLLQELGLEECADTYVGGELFTGISGGQRKRTSVGVDLVTNPDMLFLDEPTSGLDAYSAHTLVKLLRRVAAAGATVAATIHQPSSEVFDLFDVVILLKNGRVVYDGDLPGMNEHFGSHGYPLPMRHNPADHAMEVLQIMEEDELEKQSIFASPPESTGNLPKLGFRADSSSTKLGKTESHSNFFAEMGWLGRREALNTVRNTGALQIRFGSTIFLNLLFALIFQGAGNADDSDPDNLSNHFGALTLVTISTMFGAALPVASEFPYQRPVFLREYVASTYSATAYFLSRFPFELVIGFVQTLVALMITFWSIEFRGFFLYYLLALWALNIAASSVAVVLGCALTDVKSVTEYLTPIFVPQLLFAGFFIPISQIPVWLRWAQWLCSLKYTLNLLVLAEFTTECSDEEAENCADLRDDNNIERRLLGLYVGMLVLLIIGFRSIALFVLVSKSKTVY